MQRIPGKEVCSTGVAQPSQQGRSLLASEGLENGVLRELFQLGIPPETKQIPGQCFHLAMRVSLANSSPSASAMAASMVLMPGTLEHFAGLKMKVKPSKAITLTMMGKG